MRKTLTLLLLISIISFLQSQNSSLKNDFLRKSQSLRKEKRNHQRSRSNNSNQSQIRYADFIKMDSYLLFVPVENSDPSQLEIDYKAEMSYNELGQNINTSYYERISNELEKDEYYEKSYDEKGRLKEYIEFYVFDSETTPSHKSVYSYYDNDLLREESYWEWNDTNWDSIGFENFLYDAEGRLIETNYYYTAIGELIKTEISYTDSLITKISSTYDSLSSDYYEYSKQETSFYSDREITIGFYKNSDGDWIMDLKEEKILPNNKTIMVEYYDYNSNDEKWILDYKLKTILNDFNKISSYLNEGYESSDKPNYGYLEEYYYSNDGVLQEVVYSKYNEDSEVYEAESKEILKSDINFSNEQMFTPFDRDDVESARYLEYKLDSLIRYSYDIFENEWLYEEAGVFYYSTLSPSLISDQATLTLKTFPNPADQIINFDSKGKEIRRISLYNSDGRLVKEISGNVNHTDVSRLNPGVYYCKLDLASNERCSGKFVINH